MIRFLVIDDISDNLTSLEAMLSLCFPGSVTLKSLNGEDGLKLAVSELPDTILLDIVMPGMDGYEVCTLLRNDDRIKHIPVIMFTAERGDKDIRIKALQSGADTFLAKPIDILELKEQVGAMLRIKESEDQNRSERDRLSVLVSERTDELEEKLKEQRKSEASLRAALNKLENSRIASLNLMEDLRKEIEVRKKTESFLKESETKFRTLFTTMQEGFALHEIICDEKGKPIEYRFLEVNPAFEKLTGLKAQDIIGKTNIEVLPDIEPFWIETYGQVALTGKQISFENYSKSLDKHFRVSAYSPESGKFATIFQDISKRIKAEELLTLEKENFRHSLDDSPLGVRITTTEGDTIYANQTILNFYGYDSLGELQRTALKNRYTPESYAQFQKRKQQRKSGDYSATDYEISIIRKNGEIRHLQVFRKEVLWDGVRQYQVIYEDITERKQAEDKIIKMNEQLQQLYIQEAEVLENERKAISREIHDELGQLLSALMINLDWTSDNIEDKTGAIERIDEMTDIVTQTIQTVQRISSDLRPNLLDDLGLIPAMEWHIQEFERRTGIKCLFKPVDFQYTDEKINIVLYRILQESLTNVMRHANSKNVYINMYQADDLLTLEVIDDGVGFNLKKVDSRKSLGFIGIGERIKPFNGKLEITSAVNKGTKISIRIPLNLKIIR